MTKYIAVHSWKVMIATCIILIFLRNNENIPQSHDFAVAPWVATCRQFNDNHCIHWLIKYFQLMFYTSCDPYFSYIHAANRLTIINHAGKEVVLRWIFRHIFTATGKRVKGEIMVSISPWQEPPSTNHSKRCFTLSDKNVELSKLEELFCATFLGKSVYQYLIRST
jgi:hypothetical protein